MQASLAVALSAWVAVAFACGEDSRPESAGGELEFARAAMDILAQVDSANTVLSQPASGASSVPGLEAYEAAEEQVRLLIVRTDSLNAPAGMEATRQSLAVLLLDEREVWVHMVLYARTRQEVHRALADELAVGVAEDSLKIRAALAAASVDPTEAGLGGPTTTPSAAPETTATSSPLTTPTAGALRTPIPSPTPTSSPQPTGTATPTSTATPTPTRPDPTVTVSPTSTPQPSATPSATPRPSPAPSASRSPMPTPSATATVAPTPVITEGELQVIRFTDRRGDPAFIAHWTVELDPGMLAAVEYPFVSGDVVEVSVVMGLDALGSKLEVAYLQDQTGVRLLEHQDFQKPRHADVEIASSGVHRFYFDNTNSGVHMIGHLLITYHVAAPGSIIPPGPG